MAVDSFKATASRGVGNEKSMTALKEVKENPEKLVGDDTCFVQKETMAEEKRLSHIAAQSQLNTD